MRYTIPLIALLIVLAACVQQTQVPQGTIACPTDRSDSCTEQYDPVCGSDNQTYSNGCHACTYEDVTWYTPGTCESDGQEEVLFEVTFRDGFTMPEFAITTYTVTQSGMTMTTQNPQREETSREDINVTEQEIGELNRIISQIGQLEEQYGEGGGPAMDAGRAIVTVAGQTTEIDPNIDDAWPPELRELKNWFDEKAGLQELPDGPGGAQEVLANPNFTECGDSRPEVCTLQYDPVCAVIDTGVRCVTEPCPSYEIQTMGNSCSACSNTNVIGYIPGECAVDREDGSDQMFPGEGEFVLCKDGGCQIVDECPAGYDEFASQIGPACQRAVTKQLVEQWEMCETSLACSEDEFCTFIDHGTSDRQFKWDSPEEAWRCMPQDYNSYLIHGSGMTTRDEFGRESTMIA